MTPDCPTRDELLAGCQAALEVLDRIANKMGAQTQGTDCDTLHVRKLLGDLLHASSPDIHDHEHLRRLVRAAHSIAFALLHEASGREILLAETCDRLSSALTLLGDVPPKAPPRNVAEHREQLLDTFDRLSEMLTGYTGAISDEDREAAEAFRGVLEEHRGLLTGPGYEDTHSYTRNAYPGVGGEEE